MSGGNILMLLLFNVVCVRRAYLQQRSTPRARLPQTLSLTPLPLLGSACPALSSRDRDTRHYPDYTLLHNSWRTALPADYKQEYRSSLLLLLLHLWRWTFRNAPALTDRASQTFSHFKRMGTLYQKPRRCLEASRRETTTPLTPTNSWDPR